MKSQPSLHTRRDLSDDELATIVEKAKHDDADALTKLCEYVYAYLYSYVFYRVKHREDAEDLTSDVVVRVVRALKSQKGNFKAWIHAIARNAVTDFYRHRAVRSEVSISDIPRDIPDQSPALSERIMTQQQLRDGLSQLTEDQRRVIVFKFIDGYNNEEIAKSMDKTIGAVKLLQFRALDSLRKYFRKKGYEIKAR